MEEKYIAKNKNNKLYFIVIGIIVLLLSIFSIYFFVNKNDNKSSVNNQKKYIVLFQKNEALNIKEESLLCKTLENSCLIKMPNIFVDSKYEVIGWSRNKDSKTADYLVNQEYEIEENLVLYAIVKLKEVKYTVTFDKNNSFRIESNSLSCNAIVGSSCNIKMPKIIAYEGYEVLGWSDNKDSEEATYLVGNSYEFNKDITLYAITKEKIKYLKDYELSLFKIENNINKSSDYVVVETSSNILGVRFPVYYVYNEKKYSSKDLEKLKIFSENSLLKLNKVDGKVLKKVADNGASIIFFGSADCDNELIETNKYTYAAYCNSRNRNMVIGYELSRLNDEYYLESIIHEMGHAFDFTMRYEVVGDLKRGITEINQYEILNGFTNKNGIEVSAKKLKNLFLFDNNGNPYSWKVLSELEVHSLKNNMYDFSAYETSDLLKLPYEYFADSFYNYYRSKSHKEKLQRFAPKTYMSLEKVISNV